MMAPLDKLIIVRPNVKRSDVTRDSYSLREQHNLNFPCLNIQL